MAKRQPATPPTIGREFLGDGAQCWLGRLGIAVVLVSVLWAIDKGFDFTDEGYYLLGYQPHQPLGLTLSNFHLIVRTILGFLTIDIIGARLLRLALTLAGLLLFSRALATFAREHGLDHYKPRVAAGVLALGMFCSYSFGPQSLSYNHLTQFLASAYCYLAIGLLSRNTSNMRRAGFIAAFGPVLILLIQIKFTSGLAFLAFGVLLIWVVFRDGRGEFFAALSLYVAALVVAAAAYCLVIQSPADVIAAFSGASRYSMTHASHGLRQLTVELARFVATTFGLLWLLVAVYAVRSTHVTTNATPALLRGVPLLVGVSLLWVWQSSNGALTPAHASFIPALSALASILVSLHAAGRLTAHGLFDLLRRSDRLVALGLLLYLSPIFVAFGSNNGVRTMAVFGAAFIYGLWLLLRHRERSAGQAILFSLVLSCSVWGIERNLIFSPYRQLPLHEQTERLDFLAQNHTLRVDPETRDFLREASFFVPGVSQSRTHVLALYRLPGLVYLLGGVSVGGFAWSVDTNDDIAEEIARSGLLPQVIISERDELNADLVRRLASFGLDLEGSYRRLGHLSYRNQKYSFFTRR